MAEPRVGVHPEYFERFEQRQDVLVEQEISTVTALVANEARIFGLGDFEVVQGIPSSTPVVTVFRLPGHGWTQVFSTLRPRGFMHLGRTLSEELGTRALHVEATDDLWGGYVLFDGGRVTEISWLCIHDDLRRIGDALGLEVPAVDEADLHEEVDYFFSRLPARPHADLAALASHLGVWLDSGETSHPELEAERVHLVRRRT